jgi:hypothetical protein
MSMRTRVLHLLIMSDRNDSVEVGQRFTLDGARVSAI